MKAIYTLALCLLFKTACKSESNIIIIEGAIENLPDGKAYLTDAHNWKTFIDSAVIEKGRFLFKIKADSAFNPFMASIFYNDGLHETRKIPLVINSQITSRPFKKPYSFETAFFLGKENVTLTGDLNSDEKVRIKGGRETELMYKYQSGFGYLDTDDSARRTKDLNVYKSIISKYQFSFFLLQSLARNKEQYARNEITSLLTLFNKDLQNSKPADEIWAYVQNTINKGEPYPKLMLRDRDGSLGYIIDSQAKINVIVFWASWCGPCRKEIPQLKEIENKFKNRGLRIISISIDEDISNWKRALELEKMPWSQYRADSIMTQKLKAVFKFNAIPALFIADSRGMRLASFTGYDSKGYDQYMSVIKSVIN